jgi:hypothetical protein
MWQRECSLAKTSDISPIFSLVKHRVIPKSEITLTMPIQGEMLVATCTIVSGCLLSLSSIDKIRQSESFSSIDSENTLDSQSRIRGGGFRSMIRTSIQTQAGLAGPSLAYPCLHFCIFHIYIYSTVYTGLEGNKLEAPGTELLLLFES